MNLTPIMVNRQETVISEAKKQGGNTRFSYTRINVTGIIEALSAYAQINIVGGRKSYR